VLVCFALLWMRGSAASAAQGTVVLAAGNALVASLLLSRQLAGRPVVPASRKIRAALLLWAVSYCAGYYAFLAFPRAINLSHFITSQALAPLCAVLLTREWAETGKTFGGALRSASPLLLLLLVAWLERSPAEGQAGAAWVKWSVFAFVFVSFLVSRTAGRVIARAHTALWLAPRLGLLTSALLFAFVLAGGGLREVEAGGPLLRDVLLVGGVILATQCLYVYGIVNTPPVLSALFISTSVPLSLLMEGVWKGASPHAATLVLSAAYCLTILRGAARPTEPEAAAA